jgi:glycerol-3-phosphate dehydrogenase (NAD(P)+)
MNIACLGAGNWGTTLAILLAEKRFSVHLWEYRKDLAEELAKHRENRLYLPDVRLPDSIAVTHQLDEALQDADMILLVVPCQVARSVCRQVAASPLRARFLVSAVKGIELKSLKRVSQIIAEELPAEISYGVLSGPSLANEVAKKHPASVVIASQHLDTAQKMQEIFSTRFFRVYASADVIGVELAGALKNIIALAAGICDGLELGMNTKGALITRGLSGMGDLITTCNSPISRNHRVGEALAKGRKLDEVLDEMVMIAEGVPTAQAALELAQRHGITMPITKAICQVLFEGKSPRQAVEELMLRKLKVED